MRVVLDIETNSLVNPSKVWVICCKDLDTKLISIFRNLTEDEKERERFNKFCEGLLQPGSILIGHNLLDFDLPVLISTLKLHLQVLYPICIDTLILSRLIDYSRPQGHSIEAYGEEFGLPKIKFNDWTKWSQQMEDYCVRDVEICAKIYDRYRRICNDPVWKPSIDLEHQFQRVCTSLHDVGFHFDILKARKLAHKVEEELKELDAKIEEAFPPREVLIREFTPKLTKFGTISRTSVPRSLWPQITSYEANRTYRHTRLNPFNASSHKQLIEVLNEAGWKPYEKTQTHIDTEREIAQLGRNSHRNGTSPIDNSSDNLYSKLEALKISGWKINENNLATLPNTAPAPARLLAKRILLEARRRSLTEWLGLVHDDGRIHGKFIGIGAWTHRMAHQRPNTANIPNEYDTSGNKKLLGKEMRSLWCAPKQRLLVGVDAEGIQLRIFAHYINDPEFTEALIKGKKDDKTDPHSLNQRVLGNVCKTRAAAKRFVYALLLGGGIWKLSQILECDEAGAKEALDRLLRRYTGFAELKQTSIPADAKRGYFIGLDGRKVAIPGDTVGERKHLCMSGYLQNGEAVIMKKATLKWHDLLKEKNAILVNFVHDEWQTECPNNGAIAREIAEIQCNSLKEVGEELKLKCPLAGSYWNDDHKDFTIGTNWYQTH